MREKIQQIQNYFLAKIESKDFEVTKVTLEDVTILIDKEFKFKFYVGSVNFCFDAPIKLLGYNNQIILDIHTKHQEAHKLAQFEKLKLELGL
jgi:hypothetical protein